MTCPSCWGRQCNYCDAKGTVPDEQLSKSFWLSEFLRSTRAAKEGVPNIPTDLIRGRLRTLACYLLQPIRDRFGPTYVSSGYRSPDLNKITPGASATSAHCSGDAADFTCRDATVTEVVDWITKSSLAYDQVIHEGGWVHGGLYHPTTRSQRKQALRKVNGVYRPY